MGFQFLTHMLREINKASVHIFFSHLSLEGRVVSCSETPQEPIQIHALSLKLSY